MYSVASDPRWLCLQLGSASSPTLLHLRRKLRKRRRWVVLGYGGTIAGRAEGAFKAEYRAGGFCLRDIVRHLLGAIDEEESDTDLSHPEGSSLVGSELHASSNMCGDRRCMQCWIGAEFCEQGGRGLHSERELRCAVDCRC